MPLIWLAESNLGNCKSLLHTLHSVVATQRGRVGKKERLAKTDSHEMQRQIKVNQKWGFGMSPPKEHTVILRQKAAQMVLKALSVAAPTDSDSLAEAISEVKGLFNRTRKKDQWDWFIVWEQLGLPEHKRLDQIVGDLVVLRKAVLNDDPIEFRNAQKRLQYCGALTSLKYSLGLENQYIEEGAGIIYMLGTREMKGLLKIGFTKRDVTSRVNEINSATGVPIPFGVRYVWLVRNPKRVEREIHELLTEYRVRPDREFFDMKYSDAVKIITKFLQETYGLSKQRGIVKRLLAEEGYGGLSSDGQDFFFHAKEANDSLSELKVGDTVEFAQLHPSLGYAASDVRRVT